MSQNWGKTFFMAQQNKNNSDKPKKKYTYVEIRVRAIDPQVKQELENIAENTNIDFMVFMRREMRLLRDRFPEHLRRDPEKLKKS